MPLPTLAPIPADAPKCGERWTHVRGHGCLILGTGYHTETGELMVMYVEASSGLLFSRPLSMWTDLVEHPGYGKLPRFQRNGRVIGPPLSPGKRMRFRLDEGCDISGDYWDKTELNDAHKLQSVLLARGYIVDLHTVYQAWALASQDHSASWLITDAGEHDIAHILQHLEEDT